MKRNRMLTILVLTLLILVLPISTVAEDCLTGDDCADPSDPEAACENCEGDYLAKIDLDEGECIGPGCDYIEITNTCNDVDSTDHKCVDWHTTIKDSTTVYVQCIYAKDGNTGGSDSETICGYTEPDSPYDGNFTNGDVFCSTYEDRGISNVVFCGTIDTEIPEFPTMAIPIAIAMLGAMFFLRRH